MTSKTIIELQSKGLAMLTHCIFEGKTLRSLASWCKEIFNTSISFGRDIACKDNCLFLPTQTNYSILRLNRENVLNYANVLRTLDCIAIKRIDNKDQGIFVDLLGLGKFEDRLREDLKASDLYYHLSNIYNINLLNLEFHVYSTKSCMKPRGWHLDGPSLKLFTYLSDVTIDDGPYSYQLGSHRHYAESFLHVKHALTSQEHKNEVCENFFKPKDTIICQGNFGTSFISDQSGIHRGLPQAAGRERYVLVAQFNT